MANLARLRHQRDVARRFFLVAMALLFVFGFGFGFASYVSAGGAGDLLYIFSPGLALWFVFAILASCGLAAAAWMFFGWRLHRLADPWAYDPDVDGPDPRVRRGLEHAEAADAKDRVPPQPPA